MNTQEMKQNILEIKELEAKKKLLEQKINEKTEAVEKEIEEYFSLNPVDSVYHDDNVHIEKETKLSKSIDSQKVLSEHLDLVVDGLKAKSLSVTLNLSKMSKILKDRGFSPEEYIKLDTKTTLKYDVSKDSEMDVEEF